MSDDEAYWKAVAIYLADCHAASAEYDGRLRSVSKSRAARFRSIAATCVEALRGDFQDKHVRDIEAVIARCEKSVMP